MCIRDRDQYAPPDVSALARRETSLHGGAIAGGGTLPGLQHPGLRLFKPGQLARGKSGGHLVERLAGRCRIGAAKTQGVRRRAASEKNQRSWLP